MALPTVRNRIRLAPYRRVGEVQRFLRSDHPGDLQHDSWRRDCTQDCARNAALVHWLGCTASQRPCRPSIAIYQDDQSTNHESGETLAHSKQARKRILVNEKKAQRNTAYRSSSRTLVRRAIEAIEAGDEEAANEAVARAIRALDRTASRGVIHKNNAARRKSRLMSKLNTMKSA